MIDLDVRPPTETSPPPLIVDARQAKPHPGNGRGPVFVDPNGAGRRWLSITGRLLAVLLGGYLVMLVGGFLGVSWVPRVSLPGVGVVVPGPEEAVDPAEVPDQVVRPAMGPQVPGTGAGQASVGPGGLTTGGLRGTGDGTIAGGAGSTALMPPTGTTSVPTAADTRRSSASSTTTTTTLATTTTRNRGQDVASQHTRRT